MNGQPDRRAGHKIFIVYILWFLKDSSRYIGQTNNLKRRIHQHLKGRVKYTSKKGTFKLIYIEKFNFRYSAVQREKYLKLRKGRRYLDLILN